MGGPMSPEIANIISSFAAGIFSVACAVVSVKGIINKRQAEDRLADALREQKQELKFQQIEKKLDEHNGYAQKFAELHDIILAQGNDIKWIKEELNGKK